MFLHVYEIVHQIQDVYVACAEPTRINVTITGSLRGSADHQAIVMAEAALGARQRGVGSVSNANICIKSLGPSTGTQKHHKKR